MLKRFLKNERGLTLIELLAVVVILGIIAAIAVPAIGNIIENSRDDATASDALQIINAAKIARAQNPGSNTFNDGTGGGVDLNAFLDSELPPGVSVTFTDGTGWSIAGHDVSGISTTDAINNPATEESIINFLEQ